jgi:hypothetical protein
MINRYLYHISNYGFIRLIKSKDFVFSLVISLLAIVISEFYCPRGLFIFNCDSTASLEFVKSATNILAPITSVVVTGLAILVSFTDKEFLAELSDIQVFANIVFMFEHTVFLALSSLIIGIIINSYGFHPLMFYGFIFLFFYTIFSIIYLIQLLVELSINKSEWVKGEDKENS